MRPSLPTGPCTAAQEDYAAGLMVRALPTSEHQTLHTIAVIAHQHSRGTTRAQHAALLQQLRQALVADGRSGGGACSLASGCCVLSASLRVAADVLIPRHRQAPLSVEHHRLSSPALARPRSSQSLPSRRYTHHSLSTARTKRVRAASSMTRNCLGEISASLLAFCAGLAPVVDTRWTRRACRGSDGAEWRLGRRSRCRALRSGPAAEQALPPSEERGDARTCVPVDATRECPALTNHPWQSEGFLHSSPKSAGCDTFASCSAL